MIDDDADIRHLISRSLSAVGFEVACFPSVEKAVQYFARATVDMVFLDLRMPNIEGGVLLAHLRRRGVKVPVVIISGSANEDELVRLKALDASFLRKPFGVEELHEMIREKGFLDTSDSLRNPGDNDYTLPTEIPLPTQLREGLEQLRKRGEFPTLDERVEELQKLMQQDAQPGVDALEDLVTSDARLVARIIARSNSPHYRGTREIGSLAEALVRLGSVEVVRIALEVLVESAFHLDSPEYTAELAAMWDRATQTAHVAHRIASFVGCDPEEAYLATLFHDVGELLVVAAANTLEEKPSLETLRPHIDALHEEFGEGALRDWDMRRRWVSIAGKHHRMPRRLTPLEAIVRLADRLGNEPNPQDVIPLDADIPLLDELPIDPDWETIRLALGLSEERFDACRFALPD